MDLSALGSLIGSIMGNDHIVAFQLPLLALCLYMFPSASDPLKEHVCRRGQILRVGKIDGSLTVKSAMRKGSKQLLSSLPYTHWVQPVGWRHGFGHSTGNGIYPIADPSSHTGLDTETCALWCIKIMYGLTLLYQKPWQCHCYQSTCPNLCIRESWWLIR